MSAKSHLLVWNAQRIFIILIVDNLLPLAITHIMTQVHFKWTKLLLTLHVSGEFDFHKNPTARECQNHGSKANKLKHHSIQFWHICSMSLIKHYKSRSTQNEHKGSHQSLHDVLPRIGFSLILFCMVRFFIL